MSDELEKRWVNASQTPEERKVKYKLAQKLGHSPKAARVFRDREFPKMYRALGMTAPKGEGKDKALSEYGYNNPKPRKDSNKQAATVFGYKKSEDNDLIDQSIQEEKDAVRNYNKRADKLESRGNEKDAKILRHIAPQEEEHRREFEEHKIIKNIKEIQSEASVTKPKTRLQEKILGDIRYLEKKAMLEKLSKTVDSLLSKQMKVYLKPGEVPPENEEIQQGEKGGKYYLSSGRGAGGPQIEEEGQTGEDNVAPQTANFNQQPQPGLPEKEEEKKPKIEPSKMDEMLKRGWAEIDQKKLKNTIPNSDEDDDKKADLDFKEPSQNQGGKTGGKLVKSKSDLTKMIKSLEVGKQISDFLEDYFDLSILGKEYPDYKINNLYKQAELLRKSVISDKASPNSQKEFSKKTTQEEFSKKTTQKSEFKYLSSEDSFEHPANPEKAAEIQKMEDFKHSDKQIYNMDKIEKIIYIDSLAHDLHTISKQHDNLYPILDKLANVSKTMGETERDDRLLILNQCAKPAELELLNNLKIFTKSLDSSQSYWKLHTKAIKHGVEALSDEDIVVLREWIYSRI